MIHHVGWSGVRLSSMIQAVRLALCFIGIGTACTDAMNMIRTNRRMQLAALAGTGMLSVLYSDVPRGHIDYFVVRSCEICSSLTEPMKHYTFYCMVSGPFSRP